MRARRLDLLDRCSLPGAWTSGMAHRLTEPVLSRVGALAAGADQSLAAQETAPPTATSRTDPRLDRIGADLGLGIRARPTMIHSTPGQFAAKLTSVWDG